MKTPEESQENRDICEECGEPVKDGWTYECLEYTFPEMSIYPVYHEEPEWNLRKGYLIINHIPCRRCEECGAEYYSEDTQTKLDQMIDDLYPVRGLGKGFESPGRPGASIGDVIIQSFV